MACPLSAALSSSGQVGWLSDKSSKHHPRDQPSTCVAEVGLGRTRWHLGKSWGESRLHGLLHKFSHLDGPLSESWLWKGPKAGGGLVV